MADPRDSVSYQRMVDMIELIELEGPQTIDEICVELGIDHQLFKVCRYGLPGRLALEDHGVTIPRPVAVEGYVYKLAEAYKTGTTSDGEPNLNKALSDTMTRQATVYTDVERLIDLLALPRTDPIRVALRSLQKDLDKVVTRMGEIAKASGAPVSQWAAYVLDKIA
jgi:hypothetical protein